MVEVKDMVRMMAAPQDKMFKILTLSIATVNRKANLIGQVQTMVEQSGDPIGFDVARWVARWLAEPNPVLTGESYMRMMEGQKLVYKRNHPTARADAKRSLGLMSGAAPPTRRIKWHYDARGDAGGAD